MNSRKYGRGQLSRKKVKRENAKRCSVATKYHGTRWIQDAPGADVPRDKGVAVAGRLVK